MGKKSKNKNKVSGAVKTAAKTEKKLALKAKKELATLGEQDIEAVVAELEREEAQRSAVTEKVLSEPPEPRAYATFTAHPTNTNEIILFGGEYHDGQKTKMYNDLLFYNTANGEWRRVKAPGAPPPRCSHQAVATAANKGELWIFGGEFTSPSESQFYHYRDLWNFNLTEKKWEKVQSAGGPSARSGHRMALLGRKLLVLGGYHDAGRDYRYYNDVHAFCLDTRTWSKLEPAGKPPAPRSGCLVFPSGDSLLVYGGFSRTRVGRQESSVTYSDTHRLSVNGAGAWRWGEAGRGGAAAAAGRGGLAAAVAANGKRAYVFGGVQDVEETEEDITGELSNELHTLDLETGRWHEVTLRVAGGGAAAGEAGAGGDTATETKEEVTILADDVFTIKLGGPSTTTPQTQTKASERRDDVVGPSPRMNAMLAMQKSVLYVYGGILEKGSKQFTLSDLYSLDTHKLSEWKELIPQKSLPEWCGSDSEDSYESYSGSETDSDDDDESE